MLLVINRFMSSDNTLIDFNIELLKKDFIELEEAGMLSQLILNESAANNNLIIDIDDIDFEFTPHTMQLVGDYILRHKWVKEERIGYESLLLRLTEENRIKELFIQA